MGKQKKYDKVEFKMCQRCGGLWLRRAGSLMVYCRPCAKKVEATDAE